MKKSIEKKKEKLQAKIDALIESTNAKIKAIKGEIEKYDALLVVMDEQGL